MTRQERTAGSGIVRGNRFRNLFATSALLSASLWPTSAAASGNMLISRILDGDAVPTDIVLFALFTGAFSFAMMAATWLIRERRRLDHEHRQLTHDNADLRNRYQRAQALIDVPDQRVVIWSSGEEGPVCTGSLPPSAGAPEDRSEFVAFGKWMNAESAQGFEHVVTRLRERAESFDLTIETKTGSLIEVQGRASGSHAFVRFIDLSGARAALASLEAEHTNLLQTTDTMEALLESVEMPAWLRDSDGRLFWANSAYLKAVEAETLDQACKDDLQLLDSADRKKATEALKESTQSSSPNRFKDRIPVTVAGDRRIMDVCEVATRSGSAGLAVDMNEVDVVNTILRNTLEGHSRTMDLLPTAVAVFDEHRRLIFHNAEFRTIWRLDERKLQSDLSNEELFDLLRDEGHLATEEGWSKWRNSLMDVYKEDEPVRHVWHLLDGRTLQVIASPKREGGVTWVFENITEQLKLESRYASLMQVQGETLDNLGEAIAVFGSDGRLRLSNPAFQKMWELEDSDVQSGTPITDIALRGRALSEDDSFWDTIVASVTGVEDAREQLSGRFTLPSKIILDYALVPLPDGQAMLSFVDVTANVTMEQALTERNEALEEAEGLKNAFIEHVSYEFRAPLTNIVGFAEALEHQLHGELNERQHDYVDHILSSSRVLHSMVDNMLDLATVDAGFMELDLKSIDLMQAVQDAVKSVKDQLREQNVRVRIEFPDRPVGFVADGTRVQQVLFNLLTNAIRVSPEGSEVRVETSADRDFVTLAVRDSGPGVPEEVRDRIFDRFAAKPNQGSRSGAGLGLSIARSLVELHGGTIELDENQSEGAGFVCRLPLRPAVETIAAE